jgi:hypothetical protein
MLEHDANVRVISTTALIFDRGNELTIERNLIHPRTQAEIMKNKQ